MCEFNPLWVQRGITGYWMPNKAKFPDLQARIFEMGFPGDTSGKESACQWRKCKRLNPWVRKIPWIRQWQPVPVFLPGKFHRQKSLVGYRSRVCKELDTTDHEHNIWTTPYCFYFCSCIYLQINCSYLDC